MYLKGRSSKSRRVPLPCFRWLPGRWLRGSPRLGPKIFKDLAHSSFDREASEHFKDDILSGYPGLESTSESYADNPGHGEMERMAGHGHGHIQSARTDSQHAASAIGRRMTVRSQQSLSGNAETLEMDLMGYAVRCPAC